MRASSSSPMALGISQPSQSSMACTASRDSIILFIKTRTIPTLTAMGKIDFSSIPVLNSFFQPIKYFLTMFTEHCIDWLRQYVQCNADTTLIPFYWGTKQKSPLAVDKGKHQCVKWDKLEHWASERAFDAFTPGLLVHPIFGMCSLSDKSSSANYYRGPIQRREERR